MRKITKKIPLVKWLIDQLLNSEPHVEVAPGFVKQFEHHMNIMLGNGFLMTPDEDPWTYWTFLMEDLARPGEPVACHKGLVHLMTNLAAAMTIECLARNVELQNFIAEAVLALRLHEKVNVLESDSHVFVYSRHLPDVVISVMFRKRRGSPKRSEAIARLNEPISRVQHSAEEQERLEGLATGRYVLVPADSADES